jgi:thiamine-phosphate pyrophosphorylase
LRGGRALKGPCQGRLSRMSTDAAVHQQRDTRLAKLQAAQLYLCTPTPMAPTGVHIVQLRQKGLEWREEAALLRTLRDEVVRAAARNGAHPALISANDRADLAAFAPVDVLHLGQDDLPPALARRIVGPDVLLGLSTHDEVQLQAAIDDPDIDYFCVGPVWETPTKAGRPGVGLGLLERAAALAPPLAHGSRPWFVTGGVAPDTLDDVLSTGARRVVVVRAITQAEDPDAVAGELAARLAAAAG